jgi:hypothetical protein
MESEKDPQKRPDREEREHEKAHEDTRHGGGDWGTHSDRGDEGRRSEKPTTRGGGNKKRYDMLLDDE